MIRTRDFLLYMLILGFVVLGAVYTGLSSRAVAEVQEILFAPSPPVDTSVITSDTPDTVATRMAELRARLAAGDGYRDDAPPVFTSVDQVAQQAQATAATGTNEFSGSRNVTWCSGPQVSPLVASWPSAPELSAVEGQRVVTSRVSEEVVMGSTTETVVTEETLLAMPVRTVRTTFSSCVPDTLVGVTVTGQPLINETAVQYYGAPERQVIGFTRDGFGVYGPVADESMLDECGGQYVGGQYQYHIRVSEPFIIACYAGVPAQL